MTRSPVGSNVDGNLAGTGGHTSRSPRRVQARNFGLIGSAAMLAAGGSAGILGAALLATPSGAAGTTWIVDSLGDGVADAAHCAPPTNGACTLRDALKAQQSGDTITFDASLTGGTINLTAAQGQLKVDHKTVTITGPGSGSLTVNQTVANKPVFYLVAYKYDVVMTGLAIIGGTKSGINAYGVNNLTLVDVEVTGNSGTGGGGVRLNNFYGDLTITDSYIHGNTASDKGGGLLVNPTSGVPGTGIVTISRTEISNNNSSGGGGGVFLQNSESVTIGDSTFSGNVSGNGGGALYINVNADPVNITGSTFYANSAYYQGGAILSASANLTISNSTFAENIGMGGGGLSALNGSSLTVNQSTFTANSATGSDQDYAGGGGINFRGTVAVTMSGTIVSANTAAVSGQADIGLVDAQSATITSTNSLLGDIDSRIALLGSGNVRSSTPGLGLLADNGGPTRTMALLTGSAALDAGPDPVATFAGNEYDQRGVGFPRVAGGMVDIGAYEFQPEPEPTTTTTSTTTTVPGTSSTTTAADIVIPQFTG